VAATFHPELTASRELHRYVVSLAGQRELAGAQAARG
jgi:glutamine amidotransferase PdxT